MHAVPFTAKEAAARVRAAAAHVIGVVDPYRVSENKLAEFRRERRKKWAQQAQKRYDDAKRDCDKAKKF